MKIKDTINFSHKWDKLDKPTFKTIRGKTAIEQYIKGDIIEVLIKKNYKFHAKIINMQLTTINQIPLFTLQEDVAPQKCDSHEQYAEILNFFWKWVDVTISTPVTLFTLERTKEIGWRKNKTTQSRLNPFKKK